ncbi:MAG: hypothetical protein RIC14_12640 [Filomicrobium sp.]
MGPIEDHQRAQCAGYPAAGAVRDQLERILASALFADAPRLKRFLGYVVDQSLAGRSDRLKGYAIGLEVFDRNEDFDPQTDTIVRVQAGQLRKRLDLYYADEGSTDDLRILIPKGRYVPEFHTVKEEVSVVRNGSADAGAKQHFDASIHGVKKGGAPSLLVLPFQNHSSDPANSFFAEGITEETVANLARFRELFVFSRTTSLRLAQEGADIRSLNEELGVDFVLEGSVRQSSTVVRVTVRLIDAATDDHILSEQFERPLTPEGLLVIQDEIALLVAGRVASHHGPIRRFGARTSDLGAVQSLSAFQWISAFHHYYRTHDPKLHKEVRQGLTDCLDVNSEWSDGHAALAIVLLDEHRLHINERQDFAALEKAFEHAERATHYDAESAFAFLARALTYYHRREFPEFRLAGERAINLNPGHAVVLADIGHCYCLSGEWDFGLPLIDRATELSPVHPGWYNHGRALYHYINDDPEAALLELKNVQMPGFSWYVAFLAAFYAELGRHSDAHAQAQLLLELEPQFGRFVRKDFGIWCVAEPLTERIIGSWRKAGLEIE